jgi:GNAT superfamily N-acetyltransferase
MNYTQLRQWARIVGIVDRISNALENGFYEIFKNQGFSTDEPSLLFLGSTDGQPVAASRLYCAGGVAGIWHVATLPEARGRGYGTAMTLVTAHAGLSLGYRMGVLLASPAGYGIYHRLGFQEYCHLDVYRSPDFEYRE